MTLWYFFLDNIGCKMFILRYLLRNGTLTLYRTNGTYVNAPPTVNRMEYMYSILGLSMIGHIISNIDTINTITGTIMGTYR